MCLIAFGNGDGRNFCVVETERASALFTMEVWVLVVVMVVIMTVAELVAQAIAVLDDMHEVFLSEEREGTEDVRLVDGADGMFKFDERHRPQGRGESLDDDNAIGRWPDVVSVEKCGVVQWELRGCFMSAKLRISRQTAKRKPKFLCRVVKKSHLRECLWLKKIAQARLSTLIKMQLRSNFFAVGYCFLEKIN